MSWILSPDSWFLSPDAAISFPWPTIARLCPSHICRIFAPQQFGWHSSLSSSVVPLYGLLYGIWPCLYGLIPVSVGNCNCSQVIPSGNCSLCQPLLLVSGLANRNKTKVIVKWMRLYSHNILYVCICIYIEPWILRSVFPPGRNMQFIMCALLRNSEWLKLLFICTWLMDARVLLL